MAESIDYVTDYSGEEIDQAIWNALNLKEAMDNERVLSVITVGRDDVQDLSDLSALGAYMVEQYTDGPSFSPDSTEGVAPILVIVSAKKDEAGNVSEMYQFTVINGKMAYRTKTAASMWGSWTNIGDQSLYTASVAKTTATSPYNVTQYRVTDVSLTKDIIIPGYHFAVIFDDSRDLVNADGATIQIVYKNGDNVNYPIYSSDGKKILKGAFRTGAYAEFYLGYAGVTTSSYAFYCIGGASGIDETIRATTDYFAKTTASMASGFMIYNSGSYDLPVMQTSALSKTAANNLAAVVDGGTTHKNRLIMTGNSADTFQVSSIDPDQVSMLQGLIPSTSGNPSAESNGWDTDTWRGHISNPDGPQYILGTDVNGQIKFFTPFSNGDSMKNGYLLYNSGTTAEPTITTTTLLMKSANSLATALTESNGANVNKDKLLVVGDSGSSVKVSEITNSQLTALSKIMGTDTAAVKASGVVITDANNKLTSETKTGRMIFAVNPKTDSGDSVEVLIKDSLPFIPVGTPTY